MATDVRVHLGVHSETGLLLLTDLQARGSGGGGDMGSALQVRTQAVRGEYKRGLVVRPIRHQVCLYSVCLLTSGMTQTSTCTTPSGLAAEFARLL
jgi:hypothetical protein